MSFFPCQGSKSPVPPGRSILLSPILKLALRTYSDLRLLISGLQYMIFSIVLSCRIIKEKMKKQKKK